MIMTIVIVNYDACHSTLNSMKQKSREQMIEGALSLLAKNGLQATSFSEVLKLTKAPRGSIYHHFPGGKDQLVIEALELSKERTIAAIKAIDSTRPERIIEDFFGLWRAQLLKSDFTIGSVMTAITVATQDPKLLECSAGIFMSWQDTLADKLRGAGLSEERAANFAVMVITANEGAVALARATKDIAPFDRVVEQFIQQAKAPAIKDESILWTREKRS